MLATRTDEVPVTVDTRKEPTVLTHGRSTYRRGAGAPEGSSLPFFVLVGIAVGLFAFAMMHVCLPDPLEKIAAREAAAAPPVPPPPAFKALEAPPPVAEVVAAPAEPAPAAQASASSAAPAPAKQARVVRRATAKKVSAKLPSNPYAN